MRSFIDGFFRGNYLGELLIILVLAGFLSACSTPQQISPQLFLEEVEKDVQLQSGLAISKGEEQPSLEQQQATASPSPQNAVVGEGSDVDLEDAVDVETSNAQGEIIEAESPDVALPSPVVPTDAVDVSTADLPVGPKLGYLAPNFVLQTPDGQTIQLDDLRGRPVLINYWTSWCGPCQHEMEILQGVYQAYQSEGFTVVAVNAIEQDTLGAVEGMVDKLGVTYPVVLDHGNEFADSYNALFFPTSYFVDANGVIQDIALGDSPEADFRARVDRFLASQ